MMVSGSKEEIPKNRVDPCVKCRKRVIKNSVLSTKCGYECENEESAFNSDKSFHL